MKIIPLLGALSALIGSGPALAQHATRPDYPNNASDGVKFEHFTKEQWESSNYATQDRMKQWQDLRYGMFIHFGITSKAERDLSWGSIAQRYAPDTPSIMANGQKRNEEWTTWPKDMKLEKFNAKEWVEIARRMGFKYIVVTTKHHEGFHMWDTAFSDFKITNTPFGRDYIKELVAACHQAQMPVGFYFAQREWYHPDYQPVDMNKVTMNGAHWTLKPGETSPLGPRHAKYLEYMKNAVRELCTKYGKIDIWWWDAVSWDGMFTKEMWDSENVTRMIRDLQPGIVINNRASLPGDFDTPEGHLGAFQDWRPWESCIPLSDAWCYTGAPAHSFDHVLHLVVGAACGNGNLLLSWGPQWDGSFDRAQTTRLDEIGDWLKENGESIYGTRGGPWKPAPWGGSTHKGNTAYVHLFQHPAGALALPAIPGRQVISARLLKAGTPVEFKQSAQQLAITLPPQTVIKGDLVIALTMNDSLDGLPSVSADDVGCSFAVDSATRAATVPAPLPEDYNIVWDSQSKDSTGSMPLAGHNIGLNVWVENNDLLFLIASPNCMDEKGMQVKLGLIRINTAPVIFAAGFRQELRLRQSEITVSGTTPAGKAATITLWCEANKPIVHAVLDSAAPVTLTASYETWSDYQAGHKSGGIQWVKRLPEENPRRLRDMQAQGMTEFTKQIPDPLSKLTLGGRLDAPGMAPTTPAKGKFNGLETQATTLTTAAPVAKLDLTLTLRMEQDASLAAWQTALTADAKQATVSTATARAAALAWWEKFWDRSHIFITPRPGVDPANDSAWQAARNYQLIRYLLAANPSGRAMTLFNGGNFACTGNPDQRNWDFCQFMAQNQRLVYWPMLRSGDFDMLQVATDFYRDRTAMRRLHAKKFWQVDGVTYPEPFSIFGLDAIGTTAEGRSTPDHLHYHYTSGMEFALMMLELNRYNGTDHPGYREPALGILTYYDQFYQKTLRQKTGQPLDANGRLVIYPSDACEPYHGCTNNTDVIAGLTALTRELVATPTGALPPAQRTWLAGFQKRLPVFPMKEQDGRKYFAAADSWEKVFSNGNMDFPQMYICFPFSILSLGRSDMSLAKNTWDLSAINPAVQHQNQCWYQTAINFARMGQTTEAADFTMRKLLHPGARFPAFYRTSYAAGGEFCHLPDTDHGGVAMTALQEMIMQTDGKRILLGPAWPAEWNCNFKLHAPYQTTVAGHVADGKMVVDKVTPESRRKDITIFPLKGLPKPPVSAGKPATASSVHSTGYKPDKAFDGDTATRWASAVGQTEAWLEVDLGTETAIGRAVIDESSYPQTLKFAIEAQQADGTWKPVFEGGAIGPNLEVKFPPATARKFRLHVLDSKLIGPLSGVNINEFQLTGS